MELDSSEEDDPPIEALIGFDDACRGYCSESSVYRDSEDDYNFPDASEDDDTAKNNFFSRHDVERIFRIPPKTYCKTTKLVHILDETKKKEDLNAQKALCQTCSSPVDRFYSCCTEECFKVRGREGENRSFFYLRQAFHRKPSSKFIR
jgi:hypothetical protein